MTIPSPADLKVFAEQLAAEAAAVARRELARTKVTIKADGSPVTTVDIAVEEALRARIEAAYPDHGIVGEEFAPRAPDADWVWVVDPIDGTRQFAAGLPNYGILIALCHRGKPELGVICQPRLGDVTLGLSAGGAWLNGAPIQTAPAASLAETIVCFSDPDAFDAATRPGFEALRAASRWNVFDGGCLGFAALAAGRLGVSVCGPNLDSFDICALVPVVEGAGGVITDWQGGPLTLASRGEIVASGSAALHEAVLETLAKAAADAPQA